MNLFNLFFPTDDKHQILYVPVLRHVDPELDEMNADANDKPDHYTNGE